MASLKERIESNPVVWFLSALVGAFVVGFGAYGTIQTVGGLQPTSTAELNQLKAKAADLQSQVDTLTAQLTAAKTQSSQPQIPPASQWKHIAMPVGASGSDVANKLTDLGPAPQNVVVEYDGSSNNIFHIWYVAGGPRWTYAYTPGRANELNTSPPPLNFFINDGTIVPAGIGGEGGVATPIYFTASKSPSSP